MATEASSCARSGCGRFRIAHANLFLSPDNAAATDMPGSTISEKILARASGMAEVKTGDVVTARVGLATAHDACAKVLGPFERMGAARVWDPEKIAISLDHWAPATTGAAASLHAKTRRFVKEQGIRHFYDLGRGGVCHQVVMEEGLARPGLLILGTDSHTTTLGAAGAFAAGIGVTEMAAVFATGRIWLKVPPTVRITLSGKPDKFICAKDYILHIIGKLGRDSAAYKAVEFCGPAVDALGLSQRMTLCNMSAEMGAKAGIVAGKGKGAPASDDDARFESVNDFNIGGLTPQVACPPSLENVQPASTVARKRIPVDQAFIGSCTNGRLEDLQAAESILRGEKIHPRTRLLVSPASQRVYRQALKAGIISSLAESGAAVLGPGCAACFGGHVGILAPREVCVSTGNRNFTGRMGDASSRVYLASPAVAAASALYGEITSPEDI